MSIIRKILNKIFKKNIVTTPTIRHSYERWVGEGKQTAKMTNLP